ncbi:Peptidyl-tRNA hydrolase ict1, mitochondrial [Blomia tropicalis]|nr:Peptidyl-tRNA hydrolase ict1, mitochondrial [Blomia tropicalis]
MLSIQYFRSISWGVNKRFLSGIGSYPKFSSNHSLDKLYPQSSTASSAEIDKSFDGDKFTGYIPIKNWISHIAPVPDREVTVKFHVQSADWIPDEVKKRISELHKNSINKDGYWLIRSDKTRQQSLNLADCMDKLRCYVAEATKPPILEPTHETLEIIKARRERAAIRRLETKKHRSLFKSQKRLDF